MNTQARCGNCLHARRITTDDERELYLEPFVLRCQAGPPTAILVGKKVGVAWPPVYAADHCGQWVPAADNDAEGE